MVLEMRWLHIGQPQARRPNDASGSPTKKGADVIPQVSMNKPSGLEFSFQTEALPPPLFTLDPTHAMRDPNSVSFVFPISWLESSVYSKSCSLMINWFACLSSAVGHCCYISHTVTSLAQGQYGDSSDGEEEHNAWNDLLGRSLHCEIGLVMVALFGPKAAIAMFQTFFSFCHRDCSIERSSMEHFLVLFWFAVLSCFHVLGTLVR